MAINGVAPDNSMELTQCKRGQVHNMYQEDNKATREQSILATRARKADRADMTKFLIFVSFYPVFALSDYNA
jgi:hypothetical protein